MVDESSWSANKNINATGATIQSVIFMSMYILCSSVILPFRRVSDNLRLFMGE